MLRSFRDASKSKIGTAVVVLIGLFILIGFAMGDMQSLGLGNGGLSSSTLAKAGSFEVTDSDMNDAMQRRLSQVRQENPEADYSMIAGDFDPLLETLLNDRALSAFAKRHGFVVSKRLVDAEIANLPGVKGLNGQVSEEAYQAFLSRQRMTDAELRQLIEGSILQRLLLTPAATNARVPVGVARPYASMLLEERQGEVLLLPAAAFAGGLNPTDAQLQQFYGANRNRYMVPEQRVLRLARIGPEQVANVQATEQEIAAFYQQNQAQYGAKDLRTISQAVVQDQQVAAQIAQRAKSGQSFAEAARPAGLSQQDVTLGQQTRQQFADVVGDQVAAAAFNASAGAVVGPIQSELGWHVIKIEDAERQAGRSLAQVRGEIAAQITAEKRNEALATLVDRVQDAIDNGANFEEAARQGGLSVTATPPITAAGVQRGNETYKFPEELAPALKSGFELAPTDEPVIEQLGENEGFVLVSPGQVTPAAPAPLASIRDRVRSDWILQQAAARAKAAADRIAAAARNGSLADAAKTVQASIPPVQNVQARRIQLSQMGGQVPAPLRVLFTKGQGKVEVGSDPQMRGYFVVKVNKIVPGNALNNPGLISQVQQEFSQPATQEYAQQFMQALRKQVGIQRNEAAIAAAKQRIAGGQ